MVFLIQRSQNKDSIVRAVGDNSLFYIDSLDFTFFKDKAALLSKTVNSTTNLKFYITHLQQKKSTFIFLVSTTMLLQNIFFSYK
jgi:hypothetical protein